MGKNTYGEDFVITRPDAVDTSTAISGIGTVSEADTAYQGESVSLTGGVFIKASGANSGTLYVGNDGAGSVSSSTGYELAAGDVGYFNTENLNQLYFAASVGTTIYNWTKV